MNANELWRMPPEQFNEWRRNNDYPIIFGTFETTLPLFNAWMHETKISKELMFEHGLGIFVGSEEAWSLFTYKHDNKTRAFKTNDLKISHLRNPDITSEERIIEPYFCWLKKRSDIYQKTKNEFRISSWIGGQPFFMNHFPLLNLGNMTVQAPILSGRLLDFVCLDSLKMIGAINNTHSHIYFSSAKGLEIKGGVAFLYFFQTPLWDSGYGNIKKEFLLSDGLFQDLHFKHCELRIGIIRSKLNLCSFEGINFEATLEHSEITNSIFLLGKNEYQNKTKEKEYYNKIKKLYSSIGNHFEAGRFFYNEKTSEMLSFLRPSNNFRDEWRTKKTSEKALFSISCYIKFILLLGSFLVWGFGEKPTRSLFCSTAVIFISAAIYYINISSVTANKAIESLYFSIVTFVTLGYGDIYQKASTLRLYSAFEALVGMVIMGLFLAGLASKSKQY